MAGRVDGTGNNDTVQFVVGNTYRQLLSSKAKLDRSGEHKKIHDWTLFVDVVRGDPDIVDRVSFDLGLSFHPQIFYCVCPIPVVRPNGERAWRFSTRQQTYGPVQAKVCLRGRGGSVLKTFHSVAITNTDAGKKSPLQTFTESRKLNPMRLIKLDESQRFGIELEMTSSVGVPPEAVASSLRAGGRIVTVFHDYGEARSTPSSGWKVVPDSSILCSASLPDCNKFELVSPVLQGGTGLGEVSKVLRSIENVEPRLKVNKSMGFHVHVDVSSLSQEQLIKVCQNFIKYELVMDTLMPPSRRADNNSFCHSNVHGVPGMANRQRHDILAACSDIESLVHMMNRSGRYYKLNLTNLQSRRQPTVEFRQHSSTVNYDKVGAWVRFCVAFVLHSAKLGSPTPFKENKDIDEQFDCLFQYVIKDRALRDYYRQRRQELEHDRSNNGSHHQASTVEEGEGACCSGCETDGTCERKKRARFLHNIS